MQPITLEYLRSFRIYNIAIFDLVMSYIGIYLLSPLLIKIFNIFKIKTNKSFWLWQTLPLSIIIHILVGQQTELTRMILNPQSYYLVKLIVILMVIIGFKAIKTKKG